MNIKRAFFLGLSLSLLSLSCSSLVPSQKTRQTALSSQSDATTALGLAVEKTVSTPVAPAITVSGSSNSISVKVDGRVQEQTKTSSAWSGSAKLDDATDSFLKVSIPLGIKLALIGVGLILVVYGIKVVRKSSASADAAIGTADAALANVIRRYRDRASLSVEPKEIADANLHIATLEAERGKLNSTSK